MKQNSDDRQIVKLTEQTPHRVQYLNGGSIESMYINLGETLEGWYYSTGMGDENGIYGFQASDVGPFQSEADVLYTALNQAVTMALEYEATSVLVTERLSELHYWPVNAWKRHRLLALKAGERWHPDSDDDMEIWEPVAKAGCVFERI